MNQRQILIDKCAFQGIAGGLLCSFVQDHFLVLPHLLYGEIATDSDDDRRKDILGRFEKVLLSGAYWAPSARFMIEREARSLQPYGFLADLTETSSARGRFCRGRTLSSDLAGDAVASYLDSARVVLEDSQMICRTVVPRILAQADTRRAELERCREHRHQFWIGEIDGTDALNVHEIAVSAFQRWTRVPDKFCLSKEWVSWQYIRLATVLNLEYAFLKKGRGGTKEHRAAEHDLHDLEYVVLLSRADAIITRDNRFVEPLARAAFPEKDVFSSLEEVSGSYRSGWASS
jgi:hypothetical protein